MSTSLRLIIIFTSTFILPFATSLTLPPNLSLVTPSLNIPINTTYPPSSQIINATTPWPPRTWPEAPFAVIIPRQNPPAFLYFLHLTHPVQRAQTDALVFAIDTQIARYEAIIGLPGPFTIAVRSVRFSLRLAAPHVGESWLSKELAIAALEVLKEAVAGAGATQMRFVVTVGKAIKATAWVRFVEPVEA